MANIDPNNVLQDPNVNPRMRIAAEQAFAEAQAEGLQPLLGASSGYRSAEHQDALHQKYLQGGPKAAQAWHSAHNYGVGLDVYLKDDEGNLVDRGPDYDRLIAIMRSHGFSWGVQNDSDHFQFHPGVPGLMNGADFLARKADVEREASTQGAGPLDRTNFLQRIWDSLSGRSSGAQDESGQRQAIRDQQQAEQSDTTLRQQYEQEQALLDQQRRDTEAQDTALRQQYEQEQASLDQQRRDTEVQDTALRQQYEQEQELLEQQRRDAEARDAVLHDQFDQEQALRNQEETRDTQQDIEQREREEQQQRQEEENLERQEQIQEEQERQQQLDRQIEPFHPGGID